MILFETNPTKWSQYANESQLFCLIDLWLPICHSMMYHRRTCDDFHQPNPHMMFFDDLYFEPNLVCDVARVGSVKGKGHVIESTP
jgi:hypothetical protein